MVLLGEGYYADITSTQTVDILQRRGESLNSQVDSLQAMINNLSSFINVTDSEVAEGLVEIREEYVEGESEEEGSESDSAIEDVPSSGNDTSKEVDYAEFLSLMDELEKKKHLLKKMAMTVIQVRRLLLISMIVNIRDLPTTVNSDNPLRRHKLVPEQSSSFADVNTQRRPISNFRKPTIHSTLSSTSAFRYHH